MNASRIRNLEVMQPKNRNQHGYVFGGYLLRRSLEAAWLSAYKHCGRPAVFAGADDVTFGRPVEVGKVIEVSSRRPCPTMPWMHWRGSSSSRRYTCIWRRTTFTTTSVGPRGNGGIGGGSGASTFDHPCPSP
jgi:hypothetical protein